jgi:exopolysaccharide biosynthesis polyprenyl glycosylphosphotransferase
MNEVHTRTETMKSGAVPRTGEMDLPRTRRLQTFTYKAALVLHDLMVVLMTFGITFWLSRTGFTAVENFLQAVTLCAVSLVSIAFYPTQNLYSYHLIYSRKFHLIGQLKAAGLSILTMAMIAGVYIGTAFLPGISLVPLLVGFALLAVLAGRYLGDSILYVLRALGLAVLIIGLAGLASIEEMPLLLVNRHSIILTLLIATAILLLSRFFLVHIVFSNWMKRRFRRQVVIIGSSEDSNHIGRHIVKTDAPFWIVGVLGITDAEIFLDIGIEKCFLGSLNRLPDVVQEEKISEIIITDENIEKRTLVSLLDYCTSKGVDAWFSPTLMPIIDVKLHIDNFCGIPLIRLCSQKHSWLFNKIKHSLDALMTLPGFVVQLPLFLAIAAAIKLESQGPVFYKAKAIGRNGQLFNMLKFRSMQVNNQHDIHKKYVTKLIKGEIGKEKKGDEPLKIINDPRVTRVGKLLRKTSLDELPQIINVLKGEMSLVGPRPCLPYEYEIYKDWYKKRTAIRPGITGLWQVAGRSEVSFEDMILLDLYYVYNRSVMMDFSILYETGFAVLARKGAY